MSETLTSTRPTVRGTDQGGRSVLAVLETDSGNDALDDAVIWSAIGHAGPDGLVVVAAVSPPRPLVSHYWFMTEFGVGLWRDDRPLPDGPALAVCRALEHLDRAAVSHVVEKITRPEGVLRGRRDRMIAESLAEFADRHSADVAVVGRTRRRGTTIASRLGELTELTVDEVTARPDADPGDDRGLVDTRAHHLI